MIYFLKEDAAAPSEGGLLVHTAITTFSRNLSGLSRLSWPAQWRRPNCAGEGGNEDRVVQWTFLHVHDGLSELSLIQNTLGFESTFTLVRDTLYFTALT